MSDEVEQLEKRVKRLESRNELLEGVVTNMIKNNCKIKDSEECKEQYSEIGKYICLDCEL